MVKCFMFTIFLAIRVNVIAGIVVKQRPTLLSEILIGRKNYGGEKNFEINTNHRTFTTEITPQSQRKFRRPAIKEIDHNKNSKIQGTPSSLISSAADSKTDSSFRVPIKHTALTRRKTTYLTSSSKPIYETDFGSDVELFKQNHQPDAYYYRPLGLGHSQAIHETPKDSKISHASNELAAAFITLERHLKPFTNPDSYNSDLHLPTNPILGLILSQYGRYLPGSSRLYSYMASNNIHNNKPFGQYKYEIDTDPVYVNY